MKLNDKKKFNVLVSYAYMNKDIEASIINVQDDCRFLLDSGAFTAWKTGRQITVDEYCNFLDNLKANPWRYFSLDVIGEPKKTMDNYEIMLKRGFKPVPIFTRGEDFSVLDDYYKTSDVVGIGGLVGTKNNKAFVNSIMKKTKGNRVHWLGFADLDFIKYYRPYMCDSSTWESSAKYGCITLYEGRGKLKQFSKKDFIKVPDKKVIKRLTELGFNYLDFSKNKSYSGGDSVLRNTGAASYLALSMDFERFLNVKMFNALSSNLAMNLFIRHFYYQTKGIRI